MSNSVPCRNPHLPHPPTPPMMCTILSLVVFFLRGKVLAQSAANSLLLHTQGRSSRPFSKARRLLAALNAAASSETPASCFSSPLCFFFFFFFSATVNFTISPGRRAPKCASWRSPWRRRDSPWAASPSCCAWPSGRSTCQSKWFCRTQWRKWWLLSGRKVSSG